MVTCKHAVNLKSTHDSIDAFNGTNDSEFLVSFKFSGVSSVADPDHLQMGGVGWGGGAGGVITFFFSALGASVWSENKGLGRGAAEGGLLPWIRH